MFIIYNNAIMQDTTYSLQWNARKTCIIRSPWKWSG